MTSADTHLVTLCCLTPQPGTEVTWRQPGPQSRPVEAERERFKYFLAVRKYNPGVVTPNDARKHLGEDVLNLRFLK